jgi:hypothetical protein
MDVRHNGGAATWHSSPQRWTVWADANAMDYGEPANDIAKGPPIEERARELIEALQNE